MERSESINFGGRIERSEESNNFCGVMESSENKDLVGGIKRRNKVFDY